VLVLVLVLARVLLVLLVLAAGCWLLLHAAVCHVAA
jgi:hypothetical protein